MIRPGQPSRPDTARLRTLKNLLSATKADAGLFCEFRRVDGVVRFGAVSVAGDRAITDPLKAMAGAPVARMFEGATPGDAPLWNQWSVFQEAENTHLGQHRILWGPVGVVTRIGLLIVDDRERLIGSLWLVSRTTMGNPRQLRHLERVLPAVRRTLIAARDVERATETTLQPACLWLDGGESPKSCRMGRVLWSDPIARRTIERLVASSSNHRTAFAGPMWLHATPVDQGTLVWALPSTETEAPPLGHLTQAERRVAFELASGATLQTIATRLGRSKETVRSHVRAIYRTLGVGSRVEVAAMMAQVPWA